MSIESTPRRRIRRRTKVILWVVGIFMALAVIGSFLPRKSATQGLTSNDSPTPGETAPRVTPLAEPSLVAEPEPDSTTEPTIEAEPTGEFATFGDGTWEVGTDIKAGTYRMREPASFCYWARLKGFGGSLEDIIVNNNEVDSQAIVTIGKNDAGFESNGCEEWSADLSQVTDSKTEFGNGTFLVKTDIAPGTYRNSGGEFCYWARLKGFSGQLSHIIANDNVLGGSTIVSIKSTDKGFTSSGCGTWMKR